MHSFIVNPGDQILSCHQGHPWGFSRAGLQAVAETVTMGMDSITNMKLLYQVLPWLQRGSPFSAHSSQGSSKVPASREPCPCTPATTWRHLLVWGPPLVPGAVPGPCQVPNHSNSSNQEPSGQQGKGLFTARGEGRDKEINREGFKTLGPRRDWRE